MMSLISLLLKLLNMDLQHPHGNAVSKNINTITSPSNTFGISGSWKYDDASISFNGKYWVATSTYTCSIDGWDEDLYARS